MQYTTNYNYSLPESDDVLETASRVGYNNNFSDIDTQIKDANDDIDSIGEEVDTISTQIGEIDTRIDTLEAHDFVVEQGTASASGNNWTYRKWNSGILEQWAIVNINTTWASWGSLFVLRQARIPYGIPFLNEPIVTCFAQARANSGNSLLCVGSYNAITEADTKTNVSIAVYRVTAGTDNIDYPVYVRAIGRWK